MAEVIVNFFNLKGGDILEGYYLFDYDMSLL